MCGIQQHHCCICGEALGAPRYDFVCEKMSGNACKSETEVVYDEFCVEHQDSPKPWRGDKPTYTELATLKLEHKINPRKKVSQELPELDSSPDVKAATKKFEDKLKLNNSSITLLKYALATM